MSKSKSSIALCLLFPLLTMLALFSPSITNVVWPLISAFFKAIWPGPVFWNSLPSILRALGYVASLLSTMYLIMLFQSRIFTQERGLSLLCTFISGVCLGLLFWYLPERDYAMFATLILNIATLFIIFASPHRPTKKPLTKTSHEHIEAAKFAYIVLVLFFAFFGIVFASFIQKTDDYRGYYTNISYRANMSVEALEAMDKQYFTAKYGQRDVSSYDLKDRIGREAPVLSVGQKESNRPWYVHIENPENGEILSSCFFNQNGAFLSSERAMSVSGRLSNNRLCSWREDEFRALVFEKATNSKS